MDSDEILFEFYCLAENKSPYDTICLDTEGVRPDLQKKTRELFFKHAEILFGTEKLDYLCRRYYQKSFATIKKENGSLTAGFVDNIAYGTSKFNVKELTPYLNETPLEDLPYEKIESIFQKINPLRYKRRNDQSKTSAFGLWGKAIKPWIDTDPSTLPAMLFYDLPLMDKEIVQLNAGSKELQSIEAKDEMIVKGFINRDLEKGDILNYGKSYYKVYDVLVTGYGLVAFALLPLIKDQEDQIPIIAFRGTQTYPSGNACDTMLNDAQISIGQRGYYVARPHIRKLFLDPNFCTQKAKIIGFSLGGAHAQRAAADNVKWLDEIVTICSPGIDSKTVDRFNQNIENIDHEISIFHERVSGDPCDLLGEMFLGLDSNKPNITIQVSYITPDPEIEVLTSPSYAHTHRYRSEKIGRYAQEYVEEGKVQRELFNQAREGSNLNEIIRRIIGPYFLYPLFLYYRFLVRIFVSSNEDDKLQRISNTFFNPSVEITKARQKPSSLKYH